MPNAVFSKITATFGLSPTSFAICNCAFANCEARANGVKVYVRPLLSWSELEPVMIGTLARSQTSLAIRVSALAKQPWTADNLLPVIRRSVSVRVTVVSLCTSERIRLSLAPPSDLMPPASLTISTASLAAATQPTPIWAMLPVVG